MPLIAERTRQLLSEEKFQDEFSHTVLHDVNVFELYKKQKLEKAQQQQKEERKEERKVSGQEEMI